MPEAVIVSAARSAIGRANKGSLKDFRPDDLTALIVQAALDKIPALDPRTVDDLILGVGLPGGESGNNMGRNVPVLLGYDEIPGTTVTRYCASSVQTTRMAFHAIKAGEGDCFIAAGVETVSRYASGASDLAPNAIFKPAGQRTIQYTLMKSAGDGTETPAATAVIGSEEQSALTVSDFLLRRSLAGLEKCQGLDAVDTVATCFKASKKSLKLSIRSLCR